MIAEIGTALASLKTMRDMAKAITDSKVDSAVRESAIELQSLILSLQSDMFTIQSQHGSLLKEKEELEQQIAKLKQWSVDAADYELKEIATGVFVYALKPQSSKSEPSHWLCPNCYERKQKAILQRKKHDHTGTFYLCPNCRTEIIDHSNASPFPMGFA